MATFTVTHIQRLNDYAVVQTLEDTEIGIAQSITLSGVGNGLDGTQKVQAVPIFLFMGTDDEGDFIYDTDVIIPNQLLFYDAGTDLERQALIPNGTLTWTQTCTWISAADVLSWLGIAVATANDTAFVTACTEASCAFAFRRRKEAGYFDSLTTVPGADVKLGTIMLAGALYRERGSVDSFASFEAMNIPGSVGSMGQINRLLGVNRSQVA
jgi:hypothetical protein